jgi:hypothetical protein
MEFVPYVCDLFLTANPMSMHNEHWVRIRKELISDLMRKNEEIRGKRLGQL